MIEASRLLAFEHLKERKSDRTNEARPSMCRGCGAIVGAGQIDCAVCGASTTKSNAPARPGVDRETIRFARAILDRPYKFTVILLVANFFVFLLMWQSSGMTSTGLSGFSWSVLIAYGAKVNHLINEQHQWWRFVTPMFVHVNLPHLLVNMYSLWVVGPYVEKLYGSARFVVFWVVTGIAGVVASYLTVMSTDTQLGSLGHFLFKTADVPSAGASGALFGLVGVLFVFGIKFRNELPEGFKRAFGTGMLPIIVINLFIGYLGRGVIDNAAHLGGLASGAALALVVEYRRPGEKTGVAITWHILRVAALGLVAVSFLKMAQHFRDPLPPLLSEQMVFDSNSTAVAFVAFAKTMNDAQEILNRSLHGDATGIDDAIKSLGSIPHFDSESAQLTERLKALLIRGKELKSPPTPLPSPSPSPAADPGNVQQEVRVLQQDFDSWKTDYEWWLKRQGSIYSGLIDTTTPQAPDKSTQ
ncbi:MAG: rhomboid family intramembrane serine protease [Pyrinomonadaceae bacterium]|nr:rhomboid family intramembrane serine protease [Pyrinomonadaceae bacterium]